MRVFKRFENKFGFLDCFVSVSFEKKLCYFSLKLLIWEATRKILFFFHKNFQFKEILSFKNKGKMYEVRNTVTRDPTRELWIFRLTLSYLSYHGYCNPANQELRQRKQGLGNQEKRIQKNVGFGSRIRDEIVWLKLFIKKSFLVFDPILWKSKRLK